MKILLKIKMIVRKKVVQMIATDKKYNFDQCNQKLIVSDNHELVC